MVSVGQYIYNSLLLVVYNYLSINVPESRQFQSGQSYELTDLIPMHGYNFQQYYIQTEDGYILQLIRLSKSLPSPPQPSNSSNKQLPVLLVHGILSSAHDFILQGPNTSLAYGLVDSGYDVWLGNCRGNSFSRQHIKYHPDDAQFWRFSYHEMGYYDLPAMLDHITNVTGHEQVFYAGHSQGTTIMFVMASEKPEYINKIRLFVAMAPVVYPKGMRSVLMSLCVLFYKQVEWVVYKMELGEILRRDKMSGNVYRLLSTPNTFYSDLFQSLLYSTFGYNDDVDMTTVHMYAHSFPAGSSSRQFLHFMQNKISDSFCKYDYGSAVNQKVYGQSHPPTYSLRTQLPTALIYSSNDWLSSEDDVYRLSAELNNLKLMYKMPGPYCHMDYIVGKKATKIILGVMKKLFQEN